MTPIKSNRAPLTKRISALAITAAAALSFTLLSPSAQAITPAKPTKEYNALQAALPTGVSVDTATADQLEAAIQAASSANPTLKPGNIAGEALKYAGSNAQDAGDDIATALIAIATDDTLAARDAIKRAGSGKDINVSLVPEFSIEFQTDNPSAISLAKLVISTKPGAGAVIGGRASELGTTQAQLDLTNQSLVKAAGITGATQDILKYVVLEVDADGGDTADFTRDVAVANVTLAPKIGTGGVAGDPTNGGNIVDTMLKDQALPKLKTGIAGFIKTVGNVADIEEISKIAIAVGTQIATPAGKSTAIKFAAANGVVKSLAKSIVSKSTGGNTSNTHPNSINNKQDEIAEVAAYMVAKILNQATVQGTGGGKPQVTAKNAGPKIFAIVMSAVNAAKPKKVQTANPGLYNGLSVDVAGSVAETLAALRDTPGQVILPEFFDAIKAFLIKKAKTIGGAANLTAVTTAINDAYEQTAGTSAPDTRFEDGTILPNALTSDYPLTDFRPF